MATAFEQLSKPGRIPLGKMHSIGGRSGMEMLSSGIDSGARAFFDSFQKNPETPAPNVAPNPTDMRLAAGTQKSPSGMPAYAPKASEAAVVGGTALKQPPAAQQLNAPGAQSVTPQASSWDFVQGSTGAYPAKPGFDFDNYQPASGQGAFRNEQTGMVTRLQSEPVGARQQLAQPPRSLASYVSGPQRQDVRAPVLNPNGGVFSSMVDFTNQAGQAMQAIAANKGMRNDRKDALDQQRVGLDSASTLAKIDQGYRSLGIDGRRADTADRLAGVQEGEFGLKRETQGIANRLATQQEQLRSQIATEQDPAKRKSLVQRLMDFEGKTQQADPYLVVPGGQQIDPVSQRAYNTPSSVFNRQTGQWMQAPQVQGGQGGAGKFEVGQVYRDSQTGAQRRWNGQAWEKV